MCEYVCVCTCVSARACKCVCVSHVGPCTCVREGVSFPDASNNYSCEMNLNKPINKCYNFLVSLFGTCPQYKWMGMALVTSDAPIPILVSVSGLY